MRNKLNLAGLIAGAALMASPALGAGLTVPNIGSRAKVRKPFPRMVTSSPEAIAEHNRNVKTRQVLRRINRPWKVLARWDAA